VPSVNYAFISSYLKGQEARLVTSEHVDSLLTASSIQDALATVRETDVGSYLEDLPVRTFGDVDECLWGYLAQRIRYVESLKFLPKEIRKLSRAYVVKYDIFNIKAALQGISTGKKASMIPVGIIYNNALLDELFDAESVGDIIQLLIKCKLEDYVPILEQYKTYEGTKSKLRFIGIVAKLDGEYYKNMLNMARRIKDGSILTKAFGLVIDLTNLQITSRAVIGGTGLDAAEFTIAGGYEIVDDTIRELLSLKIADMPARLENTQYSDVAKEILISYDKIRGITAVDEIIEKHKFRMLKEILAPRVLSPLVMVWYLILKEVEIRNLRLILKAVVDGVPVQEIRDYLVL
jgi:vacuolar-type H+-ATPase subunit C/Vma6